MCSGESRILEESARPLVELLGENITSIVIMHPLVLEQHPWFVSQEYLQMACDRNSIYNNPCQPKCNDLWLDPVQGYDAKLGQVLTGSIHWTGDYYNFCLYSQEQSSVWQPQDTGQAAVGPCC